MNRINLLSIILLLALMAGCQKEVERTDGPPETVDSSADTVGLLPAEVPAMLTDSAATYRYSARFPRTGEAIIDTLIEQFVRSQIDSFVDAPAGQPNPDWISELDINYSSSTFPPHILCYKFDAYMFTGGAHGMTSVTTMMFDMDNNHLLTLSDLFVPRSRFADTLSLLSRAELRNILGDMLNEEMLASGTEPNEANFSRFMLAPRDLVIFFEQYAVAPYAAGVQVITIPLARLAPILKPEFQAVSKPLSGQ
ncbi:MAG: DUF3298 and DUF4163 domain-containing protein [candidate division Zixibacteria bacterium]|nr:DUF3298 and DUF4163 domain-containing protein [candidate division Zixibacteria bacterium]